MADDRCEGSTCMYFSATLNGRQIHAHNCPAIYSSSVSAVSVTLRLYTSRLHLWFVNDEVSLTLSIALLSVAKYSAAWLHLVQPPSGRNCKHEHTTAECTQLYTRFSSYDQFKSIQRYCKSKHGGFQRRVRNFFYESTQTYSRNSRTRTDGCAHK